MQDLLELSADEAGLKSMNEPSSMTEKISKLFPKNNSDFSQVESWFCKSSLGNVFKISGKNNKEWQPRIQMPAKSIVGKDLPKLSVRRKGNSIFKSEESTTAFAPFNSFARKTSRPPLEISFKSLERKSIDSARNGVDVPISIAKLINQVKTTFSQHRKPLGFSSIPLGMSKQNFVNQKVSIPNTFITKKKHEHRKEEKELAKKRLKINRRLIQLYYLNLKSEVDPRSLEEFSYRPENIDLSRQDISKGLKKDLSSARKGNIIHNSDKANERDLISRRKPIVFKMSHRKTQSFK